MISYFLEGLWVLIDNLCLKTQTKQPFDTNSILRWAKNISNYRLHALHSTLYYGRYKYLVRIPLKTLGKFSLRVLSPGHHSSHSSPILLVIGQAGSFAPILSCVVSLSSQTFCLCQILQSRLPFCLLPRLLSSLPSIPLRCDKKLVCYLWLDQLNFKQGTSAKPQRHGLSSLPSQNINYPRSNANNLTTPQNPSKLRRSVCTATNEMDGWMWSDFLMTS